MTTELVHRPITPETVEVAQSLAPIFHAGHLFSGINSPEQAAIVMLVGHSLGVNLAKAFEGIYIINNRPCIAPKLELGLVLASGELLEWRHEHTDTSYTVWGRRRNGLEHSETFTLEDAIRADLVKPDGNWIRWRPNMLKWRAVGFWLDVLFPDVTSGLPRADEMGAAVDNAGNIIEVPHG